MTNPDKVAKILLLSLRGLKRRILIYISYLNYSDIIFSNLASMSSKNLNALVS